MFKFKIMYFDGREFEIEASYYTFNGPWIDFHDIEKENTVATLCTDGFLAILKMDDDQEEGGILCQKQQ